MIANVNRFRNDARLVAPLTVIALLVVGYVFKTVLPSKAPPRVQVKEIAKDASPTQPALTAPTPTTSQTSTPDEALTKVSQISRDPYFTPRLKALDDPAAGVPHQQTDEERAKKEALIRAQADDTELGAMPPLKSGSPLGGTTIVKKPEPKKEAPFVEAPPPVRPAYRVSAILFGAKPMVILVGDGTTLYLKPGDHTPTGERLVMLSPELIALVNEVAGWTYELHPEEK